MIILGIDTAAAQCAIAIVRDDECLVERITPGRHGQAERLLPMITQSLAEASLSYADLTAVAVATGPGSFTGLRVGLAAAQGLALACRILALGIDSFTAARVSQPSLADDWRLIVIESFRAELYWQLCDSAGQSMSLPACDPVETIIATLPDRPLIVCGDGAIHLEDALAARPDCLFLPATPGPQPAAIARDGQRLLQLQQFPPARACYVRPPDAKPAAKLR